MDIFKDLSASNIVIFFAFFVPGFVAMKVYDLLIAGERRDFSKGVYEVLAYSSLHYAVFYWAILAINNGTFPTDQPFAHWFLTVILFAVLPAGWPLLFLAISRIDGLKKWMRDPVPTPWDRVFLTLKQRDKPVAVILRMKDGTRIGGAYAGDSRVSSYPDPNQIFLEAVYRLTPEGRFEAPVKGSLGVIVNGSEIGAVEFMEGTKPDV